MGERKEGNSPSWKIVKKCFKKKLSIEKIKKCYIFNIFPKLNDI